MHIYYMTDFMTCNIIQYHLKLIVKSTKSPIIYIKLQISPFSQIFISRYCIPQSKISFPSIVTVKSKPFIKIYNTFNTHINYNCIIV